MAEEKFPKMMPPKPPVTMPLPQAPPPAPISPFPPMQMPPMPTPPVNIPMPPVTMPMPPVNIPMPVMPPVLDFYQLCMLIRPLVKYGLKEMQKCGPKHALTEVALIAYLMGMGYPLQMARMIVESWEYDETFRYED